MLNKELCFLVAFLLISDNIGIYFTARRLFLDFLVGNTSKKEAKQIVFLQKKKNMITMSFVKGYLKYDDDERVFKRYYFVYKMWLFSAVPLLAVFVIICFLFSRISIMATFIFLLYQTIILGVFRLPASPQLHSKYRKKRGNR